MNKPPLLLLLGAMLAAVPAFAEDLAPGLWEITMQSSIAGAAGFAPEPDRITQCLTAGDARDPSRLIAALSTQGVTGCNYTSKNYSGSRFSFAIDCAGSVGLKARGDISFSAGSMNGSITATGSLGGTTTEIQNTVSARRLGNC